MLDLLEHLKKVDWMLNLSEHLKKVDWMLNLSEHLKKMVDDERGPYGCDEASREVSNVCRMM